MLLACAPLPRPRFASALADGAAHIGADLTQVALRDNRLTPAGLSTILQKLPRQSLMYLDIANNKLGRAGIGAAEHPDTICLADR